MLFTFVCGFLLTSCSENPPAQQPPDREQDLEITTFEQRYPALNIAAKEIAVDYIDQVEADFEQAELEIEELQSAIDELLSNTTEDTLERAKQAWLDSHGAYELTNLHRYFASQLFSDAVNLEFLQYQYQINHWPIVPGYIDYVEGYPDSGIVHDINVALNSTTVREQNGAFDVSEVSLGFHTLEFLLWGSSDQVESRPVDDYLTIQNLSPEQIQSGYTLEQLASNRRRTLLGIVSDALVEDFAVLRTLLLTELPALELDVEASSGADVIIVLADAMTSMLTEELLLRSLYPILNGDFVESIQSPYSQSTQRTVSIQLSALERLLLERQTVNGTTLDQIFSAVSSDFSELFYQNFDASKSCLVLLYSNMEGTESNTQNPSEVQTVECINLLTNMIDHIERIKFELSR